MVQQVVLQAEPRTECGKGPGRRLRTNGRIPAVVYGLGRPPVNVSVNVREMEHLVGAAGTHAIVSLKVGDQTENVMLQESQRHPVTGRLLHADFFRIDLSKTIDVAVPIESVSTPVGVKDGGLLEQLLREIEVRCLPLTKPNVIRVNVESIRIGHSLFARDLPPMEGIEILTPPDTALFTVLAPRKEEELVAAPAEGEVQEPEVIGKGKEKEEGEAEEEEAKGEAKKEAKAEAKTEGKKEGKK
ncbi:MAG: 50S ribosomal protein L25 [Candidatus Sumerlaeia bacterium]|nr:50S ribosomal protein L25 [Candidatus Sumerlaeia bacterium]